MTSTLHGMDRDKHTAVRALLIREATVSSTSAASAASSSNSSSQTKVRRPVWKRPELALTSAVGLAAAVLAITATAVVVRPTPANAVSGGNGKELTVKVHRLEGAQALEDALAERGVTADITYLPRDKACAPGRYTEVSPRGLMLSVGQEQFEVTIPAGGISRGQTFVLSASATRVDGRPGTSVSFDIAEGAVAPCTVVDLP